MGACCTSDRNDKIKGITERNNSYFYVNHPSLIVELQEYIKRIESTTPPMSAMDQNYLRWKISCLKREVEQNKKNLAFEEKQRYKKRLIVEVCEGRGFYKTAGLLQFCQCMVIVTH